MCMSHSNYNIYKDPAPVENIQARDVIYSLQSRLQELLSEWPEHPTLLQARQLFSQPDMCSGNN